MDHAHYFKRNTVYKVEGDTVSLVDVHDNNTITPLDPWMGAVIALADGQHTIRQLMEYMAGQYPNGVPNNLAETIESVITRLTDTDVLELTPQPTTLPYYLSMPMDDQKPKIATEMMINDGFLRPPGE
ncbi:MAG: hypothetical protein ABFS08_13080 [Pseudomonadota bacterium]